MESSKNIFVSVIIPAYKQERKIEKDIQVIKEKMEELPYKFEIIIVVDGMVDKTYERAKKHSSKKIKIIGYLKNRGKGYAIRYGMVRSRGSVIGFIDSGMDVNPSSIPDMLKFFYLERAHIVVGSKRHPLSRVNYPFSRKIISFLSQIFIKILFGLTVRDTQAGIKFFKRSVLEDVMPRLLVKRFAFDIEILVVAYHLGYRKIFEAPIELRHDFNDSVVSQQILRVLVRTFWDTLAIFYRLRLLRYYDTGNKRKWKFDPELNFRINVG